jgi:hypothetical protein
MSSDGHALFHLLLGLGLVVVLGVQAVRKRMRKP